MVAFCENFNTVSINTGSIPVLGFMKCVECERTLNEVALFRTNPLGSPNAGWKCKDCIEGKELSPKSQSENLLDAIEFGRD